VAAYSYMGKQPIKVSEQYSESEPRVLTEHIPYYQPFLEGYWKMSSWKIEEIMQGWY
jgi:hypothetical protein